MLLHFGILLLGNFCQITVIADFVRKDIKAGGGVDLN